MNDPLNNKPSSKYKVASGEFCKQLIVFCENLLEYERVGLELVTADSASNPGVVPLYFQETECKKSVEMTSPQRTVIDSSDDATNNSIIHTVDPPILPPIMPPVQCDYDLNDIYYRAREVQDHHYSRRHLHGYYPYYPLHRAYYPDYRYCDDGYDDYGYGHVRGGYHVGLTPYYRYHPMNVAPYYRHIPRPQRALDPNADILTDNFANTLDYNNNFDLEPGFSDLMNPPAPIFRSPF